MHPFAGCQFAWGAPSAGTSTVPPSYVSFASMWVGYEPNGGLAAVSTTASNDRCDGCTFAKTALSSSALPVFYAYFIGYQACALGGFCDCNTHSAPNLCTNGAQWIRDNRAVLVNMYGQYAAKVHAASPNKPVIWWLEGDFIQYTYSGSTGQTNPLTLAEEGQLARDITCAIKSNQPNAVVAMNHSPWISNAQSTGFWAAMPMDVLDMVWVQGAGDTGTFLNSNSQNAMTATYAWLHQATGRTIMAETSFAAAGQNDRWSTATSSAIDSRMTEGVIGALVNNPPASYQTTLQSLTSQLTTLPACP